MLPPASGLDAAKAAIVEAKWAANLGALSRSVATSTLVVNKVVDMEWNFGVTAASSDVDQVQSLCPVSVSVALCICANEQLPLSLTVALLMWQVGSTFLQLKLKIDDGSGNQDAGAGSSAAGAAGDDDDASSGTSGTKTNGEVFMELTLPQFYDFLAQMEKAKTLVDYLSS